MHRHLFTYNESSLNKSFTLRTMEKGVRQMKWKCSICLTNFDDDIPPELCPFCSTPKEQFVLTDDDGNVVTEHRDAS